MAPSVRNDHRADDGKDWVSDQQNVRQAAASCAYYELSRVSAERFGFEAIEFGLGDDSLVEQLFGFRDVIDG